MADGGTTRLPSIPFGLQPVGTQGFPPVGTVSSDRVAIFGRQQYAFLFGGSTGYFAMYGRSGDDRVAQGWAELLDRRHRAFAPHGAAVSVVLPNKTTCLADLYPIALPCSELGYSVELRRNLSDRSDVLFCDSLRRLSLPEHRDTHVPWRFIDTHWTPRGARATFEEILAAFGLTVPPANLVEVEPTYRYGDLSTRWPATPVFEVISTRYEVDLPEPALEFDLLPSGVIPTAVTGRRMVWTNPDAPVDAHLAIIGNSYCGPGTDQDQLSWWFSRTMRKVTFVHTGSIPSDLMQSVKPDLLLFQQVERFLPTFPDDNLCLAEIEQVYIDNLPT
jgi:hypothetical protein